MDFSLLQPHAHHRFLRDITALKSRWPYYLIMVIDPILRFNWIFYAIFTHDTQHSSIASFLIAFSEVTRRGMWTLLRVENEHCANVAQYKASRDVPLPYHLEESLGTPSGGHASSDSNAKQAQSQKNQVGDDGLIRSPSAARVSWTGAVMGRTQSGRSTALDLPSAPDVGPSSTAAAAAAEEGRTPGEDSLRMRRRQRADTVGKKSITRILAEAHKQDFEKKRKPDTIPSVRGVEIDVTQDDDEDDDDDDDEEDDDIVASGDITDDDARSLMDERTEVREAEMLVRQGKEREEE